MKQLNMSQTNEKTVFQTLNGLIREHRHSLQPKQNEVTASSFRHTQSHRYDSEGKSKTKKAMILTPLQDRISEGVENETDTMPEKKRTDRLEKKIDQHITSTENEKRISKSSKKSEKSLSGYENFAYDGNFEKINSSSRAGSSRQPSLQSLEVVREQYCCCAKRTRCEKKLLLVVTVLSIVIIVLIIVVAIIAANRDIGEEFKKSFRTF